MKMQRLGMKRPVIILALVLVVSAISLLGCGEQWPLPTGVENRVEDFGANDTSFVRLTPDWDAAHGYTWTDPGDIQIGGDGNVFIIDHSEVNGHTGGRVVELNSNGTMIHNDLFTSVTDTTDPPLGIGQDSKLNLFMVNGTDQVFAWNQYASQVGIAEVMDSAQVRLVETGDIYTLYGDRPLWTQFLALPEGTYEDVAFFGNDDPAVTALYEQPYVFYTDSSYAIGVTVTPEFVDVAGGNNRSEEIFLADRRDDRIIQVDVRLDKLLITNQGEVIYTYVGDFAGSIIGLGQGQGSVNSPTSLVTQNASGRTSIYFAQTKGNFLVQRITGSGENWNYDISPAGAGTPELQVLEYFGTPSSIAVGEQDTRGLGLIYVADSKQNRVTSFFSGGYRFREVAVEEELVDMLAGESLDDILAETGDALDDVLNPDLVDFVAARPWSVQLDSSESLSSYLLSAGVEFGDLVDPGVPESYVAGEDTLIHLSIATDTTVSVYWPILDSPGGVGTAEGVVYISDSGNNRLLRYVRTDANTYLPTDPNQQ